MNNKKGAILILSLLVILVLTILGSAIFSRSISDLRLSERNLKEQQAFWLAEAGVYHALIALRGNFTTSEISDTSLGDGGYNVTINGTGENRTVTARGFIPFGSPWDSQRVLQVEMRKIQIAPTNFYDNALYAAGNAEINGNSYQIDGDVAYGGNISDTTHVTGSCTNSAISPLPLLSFDQLREISISQGNYHDTSNLSGPFPSSFWYNETSRTPNVVFLEGNLFVHGNSEIGGFFVVGGSVIYDATLSGTVTVNGAIYTRGSFTANGGGHALNVIGGVWANNANINGGVDIGYNTDYMNAIKDLDITTSVQIIRWRDTQDFYEPSS